MNFNDIFKSSFLETMTSVSILDMAIALILAFGLGLFIFLVYKKTFNGVMYSSSFGVTLIALTMITTIVILAVTSNVVLSLGMVGALSIVRFRTAIKEPLDIAFLFWSIGVGIVLAAGMIPLAVIGSVIIGVILLVFVNKKSHTHPYIVVVRCENHDAETQVNKFLSEKTERCVACPIERLPESHEGNTTKKLLRLPLFWLLILLMVCAGASEATMAQWSSAFTESALGVSKAIGDLAGPCLFAAFMGLSRLLYGKMSTRLNLVKTMLLSGLLCSVCYFVASLSPLPVIGLAGCALCGLAVGIMWPGSLSISAQKCPLGGTALFAFLALAGDLGATLSPTMVGYISELAGGNLKTGLLGASAFPILLVLTLLLIKGAKATRPSESA